MKNYEVTLSRTVCEKVRTTVSVFAETEEAAAEKAKAHARDHHDQWSRDLADNADYGEISVENVEEIVDVDAAE